MININLNNIPDPKVRDALRIIQDEINSSAILAAGLRLYEINLDSAVSNYAISHNLGYVPTDIIIASYNGSDFTFDWDMFTKNTIYITTLGAVSVRFFMGRSSQGTVLT